MRTLALSQQGADRHDRGPDQRPGQLSPGGSQSSAPYGEQWVPAPDDRYDASAAAASADAAAGVARHQRLLDRQRQLTFVRVEAVQEPASKGKVWMQHVVMLNYVAV